MKFRINKDIDSRLRLESSKSFSDKLAFALEDLILDFPFVKKVKANSINSHITIDYEPSKKEDLISFLKSLDGQAIEEKNDDLRMAELEIKREFESKLLKLLSSRVIYRRIYRVFLPPYFSLAILLKKTYPFIKKGIKSLLRGKLNVDVLDASAISISLLQARYNTVGSTIFLLKISSILEEWTSARSKLDLSKSLELNIDKVLVEREGKQEWISGKKLVEGDLVIVGQGSIIPADGKVVDGLAMVNEAKMTGEALAVVKKEGAYVFASTVVEEGFVKFRLEKKLEHSRIFEIVESIENSNEAKSIMESRAVSLSDRIVPYTFLLSALTFVFTRSLAKATAVLMVDYSCALKLATPLAVITGLRQAAGMNVLVKGGKYLEELADSDVFVFDKTGTLTTSEPVVKKVQAFFPYDRTKFLRMVACIEEHFPHSMGKAIVKQAELEGIVHEEEHAEVEYIVAHGIATSLDNKKVLVGSYHYIFEDNDTKISDEARELLDEDKTKYSIIYVSVDGSLAGYISLEDPVKKEAKEVLDKLRKLGVKQIHMLTGDGKRAAKNTAEELEIDKYLYEVLPIEKRDYLARLKEEDKKICMVGDGINDSPALSLANVSVSLKDGSDLAKDVADIVIQDDSLEKLPEIKKIGIAMKKRINRNYISIVGINTVLIILGIMGLATPTTTSALHNLSTLAIGSYQSKEYKI